MPDPLPYASPSQSNPLSSPTHTFSLHFPSQYPLHFQLSFHFPSLLSSFPSIPFPIIYPPSNSIPVPYPHPPLSLPSFVQLLHALLALFLNVQHRRRLW